MPTLAIAWGKELTRPWRLKTMFSDPRFIPADTDAARHRRSGMRRKSAAMAHYLTDNGQQ